MSVELTTFASHEERGQSVLKDSRHEVVLESLLILAALCTQQKMGVERRQREMSSLCEDIQCGQKRKMPFFQHPSYWKGMDQKTE